MTDEEMLKAVEEVHNTRQEYMRVYRIKNADALKEKQNNWYANHKEERRAYQREYYKNNKQGYRERKKVFAERHKEELKEYQRQYYLKNKEKLNAHKQERYAACKAQGSPYKKT